MSTEPTGAERDLRDKPYDPTGPYERAQEADPINKSVAEQFSPYRLDAASAFSLGTLVGLLSTNLHGDLKVSPITDQAGNYLRLIRFTLPGDSDHPAQAWVLAMVVE